LDWSGGWSGGAAGSQPEGGIVGEGPHAAGIGDGRDFPGGLEAVVEAGQGGGAQRVGDAVRPAGGGIRL
jgi:hypothetical protein